MKNFVPQKNRIKDELKKRHISEIQKKTKKLSTTMNRQHTQNSLTTQKSVAVHFNDVKTEETFSSQDQKLVVTTNL